MESISQVIPLADRQKIYSILANEFGFGIPIPMATVAFALINAGVNKEDYGYKKLKPFLAAMDDFLSLTDIIAGGVPQSLVTINKCEDWSADLLSEDTEEGFEAPTDMPDLFRKTALSSDYQKAPVPQGIKDELRPILSSFTYFPPSTIEILNECVPAGTNVIDLLDEDWSYACTAGALRYYEGKVIFPIHILRSDGKMPIEISIHHVTRDNPEGKPWYLCYVNTFVRPAQTSQQLIPSRELEKFAWLGTWDQFLSELADLALPEPWDFESNHDNISNQPKHPFEILRSYICTTFYRLKLEDKICIDDANTFAAFNTGLVNRCYDDIYACFLPNQSTRSVQSTSDGLSPWRFIGFCTGGSHGLGKQLVSLFNPLPEPASYFERKEDLLYDLEKDLIIDFDHILIDNISRLPLRFLEDEMRGNDAAIDLIEQALSGNASQRTHAYHALGEIVENDLHIFRRLRRCLDDAVNIATKRVRWNFKTAVPCYYPRENTMGLLLPLCLISDEEADVALVVQLMTSGNYQGQTILTMRQAYKNARLICRPDSEWLVASSGGPSNDEEDDQ